jgi:glucokinase
MAMKGDLIIGFDLGGTKMISSIYDAEGGLLASERCKTPAELGADAVYTAIRGLLEKSIGIAGADKKRIAAIGVAVPGPIDRAKGVILSLTNLGIADYDISAKLKADFGAAVSLENDVNAGTYGEFRHGAAEGYRHVLGVFVGTGIGGGLILDGRLYRGARGGAGEIGHMIIREGGALCGCGQRGCLEALASRLSISKDAVALAASGKLPAYVEKTGSDLRKFKSAFYEKALQDGDQHVTELIRYSAENLGIGIANAVNLLNPEVVVLGGGLAEKLGEPYRAMVDDSLRRHAMASMAKGLKLKLSSLGDEAVPRGAACVASEDAGLAR